MINHLLFSKEACPERSRRDLFSNTRLNQVSQFAQFAFSIVLDVIMQNKPNLCVFQAVSGDCEEKQTQTNPIQTQNKANFDLSAAPQTQNKPNSNPKQSQFFTINPNNYLLPLLSNQKYNQLLCPNTLYSWS